MRLKAVVLIVVSASSALAANITFYTDQSSFLSAITLGQTIGFEGIAPAGDSVAYNSAAGLTIGGVNFTGPTVSASVPNPPVAGFSLAVTDSAAFPALTDFGTGATLSGPGSYSTGIFSGTSGSLIIVLPVNTTSFGLTLSSVGIASGVILAGSVGGKLDLIVDGSAPYIVKPPIRPTLAFAGFVSDSPISQIEITGEGSSTFRIVADNVLLGTSAVPEPSTRILLCAGLAAFAWFGHGKSKRRA